MSSRAARADSVQMPPGAQSPMRRRSASTCSCDTVRPAATSVATGDNLNDVQLIQHVIDAAVVGEPVENCANRFLGCHRLRLLTSIPSSARRQPPRGRGIGHRWRRGGRQKSAVQQPEAVPDVLFCIALQGCFLCGAEIGRVRQ